MVVWEGPGTRVEFQSGWECCPGARAPAQWMLAGILQAVILLAGNLQLETCRTSRLATGDWKDWLRTGDW